jgi:hypothetical protein
MIHWFDPILAIDEARDLWLSEFSPGLSAQSD